jgi:hypothetical protein
MGKKALGYRHVAPRLALVGALLILAGCADGSAAANSAAANSAAANSTAANSTSAKNGGFYSGVSGGWSRP